MPGRLRAIIDFLKGLFPRKKMHIDEADAVMHIRNKEDDYQIDEVVVAMVGFDPDTGQFFRLGIWNTQHRFDAGLCIPLGQRLTFGACDGDDYLIQAADNTLNIWMAGVNMLQIAGAIDALNHAINNVAQISLDRTLGAAALADHVKVWAEDDIAVANVPQLHCADENGIQTVLSGPRMRVPFNIYLREGGNIVFDNDEDTWLHIDSDDYIYFSTGGVARLEIRNTGVDIAPDLDVTGDIEATGDITSGDDVIVGDDIILGISQRITLDDDADTYILVFGDDRIDYYVGGNLTIVMQSNSTNYYRQAIYWDASLFTPISTPGATANRCKIYGKDVSAKTEFHCLDEDGNETQLSAHDEEGYYIHRSSIPKRQKAIKIDIERFFRDKFPEYVMEETFKEHPSPELEGP